MTTGVPSAQSDRPKVETLKPRALRKGDTIGIFTPSMPAHVLFREQYQHGLQVLRSLGFRRRAFRAPTA